MSKFIFIEKTLTIRDKEVRVRELTHFERIQFASLSQEDRFAGPAMIASFGTVDPKQSQEEWAAEPTEVIDAVVDAILILSKMKKEKGTDKPAETEGGEEKEPNARRAR